MSECVPRGNCLLSLLNDKGESGFLYFKDGNIIEANKGAVWGTEAVAQILTWTVTRHEVGDLPLGMKRAVWDDLKKLVTITLGEAVASQLIIPTVTYATQATTAAETPAQHRAWSALTALTGCCALWEKTKAESWNLVFCSLATPPNFTPVQKALQASPALAQLLGGGLSHRVHWVFQTWQAWHFRVGNHEYVIGVEPGIQAMDFEVNLQKVLVQL